MAGERGTRDGGIRVERVFKRSRLDEEIVVSAYELLVPTQRWVLGSSRKAKIQPRESLPGYEEETLWRGVG